MIIEQLKRSRSEFQQPVDEQALRSALMTALPSEAIIEAVELRAGMFNNTFRVTTSTSVYILKIAPAHDANVFYNERDLMQREQSIAEQLQSLSPLVPRYLTFFKVDGRDAFLQPFIKGRLWHDVADNLSDLESAELWQQLGAFARRIHQCQGEKFGYPAPSRGFGRWSEFIVDNVDGMMADCRHYDVLHEEITEYRRLLPQFVDILDQVSTPHLLHGDLWPRNVLIDGAGEGVSIKAVFDGERAFWGDPISDWVLLLYGVPEAFWQGYGTNLLVTTDPARLAVYKGMYFVLNILETVRFAESDAEHRARLAAINAELAQYS